MASIKYVEGIGDIYKEKLQEIGIKTTDSLLKKCASPDGRKEVAQAADISPKLVLEWANHCDLMRIKGVGSEYSDLLEAAGVDTVPELAQRNAQNLFETMKETNESKKLVRQMPTESQVADWVQQAKSLPRVLTY